MSTSLFDAVPQNTIGARRGLWRSIQRMHFMFYSASCRDHSRLHSSRPTHLTNSITVQLGVSNPGDRMARKDVPTGPDRQKRKAARSRGVRLKPIKTVNRLDRRPGKHGSRRYVRPPSAKRSSSPEAMPFDSFTHSHLQPTRRPCVYVIVDAKPQSSSI